MTTMLDRVRKSVVTRLRGVCAVNEWPGLDWITRDEDVNDAVGAFDSITAEIELPAWVSVVVDVDGGGRDVLLTAIRMALAKRPIRRGTYEIQIKRRPVD